MGTTPRPTGTDDPTKKIVFRVKQITAAPVVSSTQKATVVTGDTLENGIDKGEGSLTFQIDPDRFTLLKVGDQLAIVGQ
jgi:hypothetical protein